MRERGVEKVQIAREGVSAELSYVTGLPRRRMMLATLGLEMDPFATPSGMEPRYHTFLISLENTSDRVLFFNPMTSRMVNNTKKVSYPMDYSSLYLDVARAANLTLKQLHPKNFEVQGHCDNVGSDDYNAMLSLARAKAVKNYLVAKGVDAKQLSTAGYSFSRPIVSNNTDAGRAKNRRVEFHRTR